MTLSIQSLHEHLLVSARHYQKAEAQLLELLIELDRRRGYLDLGHASLFEYCVRGLNLSESQASAYISVGRKAMMVPPLMTAIQTGELSISKAKRITRAISHGSADEWISKAKTMSHREIEFEVARIAPQVFVSERKERLSEKFFRITVALQEETFKKLEAAQDLLETNNIESTLEQVLDFFLEKKDPLLKAKRAENKSKEKPGAPTPAGGIVHVLPLRKAPPQHSARNATSLRAPIPARIEHQVQLQANGHCEHRHPDGSLCRSRRYLHFHHKIPVSQGGRNSPENLSLLCSGHHRLHHHHSR